MVTGMVHPMPRHDSRCLSLVPEAPAGVFNFTASSGPLPPSVRARLLEAMPGLLQMYHRSAAFVELAERLQAKLRAVLEVPAEYRVLFLQGGATAQFAMVPLNLCREQGAADYLHTGYWSGRALAEAQRLGVAAQRAADGRALALHAIPPADTWQLRAAAAYVYYTANETADGVEFQHPPQLSAAPLVADMSSCLLSRRVAVHRHGLIFAGAQKNMGLPGLTVVLVRETLLQGAMPGTPSLYDYRVQDQQRPAYNTPVVLAWYTAELMLDWVVEQGGLQAIERSNRSKAETVYAALDAGGLYANAVDPACRSRMNIVFDLLVPSLLPLFLEEAQHAGLQGLAGHRSRGGCRAALYNAMPEAGALALADFLADFERRHG